MKKICQLVLCSCLLIPVWGTAQINSDSLATIVHKMKGKQKIYTLSDISFGYAYKDAVKCLLYARKTLAEAKKTGNDTLINEGLNAMAIGFYVSRQMDSSLAYNYKALNIRKRLNDKRGQASSLSKIATIYTDQGKYPQSININLRLMNMYADEKDNTIYATSLINIVNAYAYLKDMRKFKKYNDMGLRLIPKLKDRQMVGRIYGNAGNYYEKVNNYDSAIYYNQLALDIFLNDNNLTEATGIYNNMGIVYRKKGNNQLAFEYYQKAYDISKASNDKYNIAYYGSNTGFVLNLMGRQNEAEVFLEEARKIAEEGKYLFIQRMVYGSLSLVKEKKGDLATALLYRKRFDVIKDSLINTERTEAIEEMEARFQNERQLKINKQLELDRKNEQLKRVKAENVSARKSKYLVIGGFGSALLILLILFIYQLRQRRQREQYNRQIIREKEQGLKAVISATEEERKRIAKDLHDGIGQQMTGLKMAWQQLSNRINRQEQENVRELERITGILDDTSTEVRSISHQMMPKVLTEMGLVSALEDMLAKTLKPAGISYEFNPLGIRNRQPEEIEISLFRIGQELINNIIKHAGATQVEVQLVQSKENISLVISDNGKGFDPEKTADGIGQLNIKSRVNTIHGHYRAEAGENAGMVFTVRIPLPKI